MACECSSTEREILMNDAPGKSIKVWNNYDAPITLSTSARVENKLLATRIEIPCVMGLNGGSARITQLTVSEKATSASDLKKKGIRLLFLADDGYAPAEGDAFAVSTAGILTDGDNEFCAAVDITTADYTTMEKAAIAHLPDGNYGRVFNKRTAGVNRSSWLYVLAAESVTYVSSTLYLQIIFERD